MSLLTGFTGAGARSIAGAGIRSNDSTGLDWFSLMTTQPELLSQQHDRFKAAGRETLPISGGFESVDPWGTRVRLLQG